MKRMAWILPTWTRSRDEGGEFAEDSRNENSTSKELQSLRSKKESRSHFLASGGCFVAVLAAVLIPSSFAYGQHDLDGHAFNPISATGPAGVCRPRRNGSMRLVRAVQPPAMGSSTTLRGTRKTVGKQPIEPGKGGQISFWTVRILANAWEWVSDWYDGEYYARSPESDPAGPETGQMHGLRGGSWLNNWKLLRASDRGRSLPGLRFNYFGLRCVRTADAR